MTYPGVVDSGIDILLYKKFVVVVGKSEVKSKYYFLNEMKCEKSLKNIPKIFDLAKQFMRFGTEDKLIEGFICTND